MPTNIKITEEPLPGQTSPKAMYCYEVKLKTHIGQIPTKLFAAVSIEQIYKDVSDDDNVKEILDLTRLGPIKILE